MMGGIDVARRALDPRVPIAPRMVRYRMRLPEGDPRVVLADVISLLPGTLAAGMSGDRLRVHVLNVDQPLVAQLSREERQIAGLFGPAAAVSGRVKDCGDG
jgi:multicomponent Na+:H+ antiporter subunit E